MHSAPWPAHNTHTHARTGAQHIPGGSRASVSHLLGSAGWALQVRMDCDEQRKLENCIGRVDALHHEVWSWMFFSWRVDFFHVYVVSGHGCFLFAVKPMPLAPEGSPKASWQHHVFGDLTCKV
eukprot:1159323-Pelagomonas_calceolata.AAC.4